MDADRNGIPCETVYSGADVLAFWGDALPTTTVPSSLTLAGLAAHVGQQWETNGGYPIEWQCQLPGVQLDRRQHCDIAEHQRQEPTAAWVSSLTKAPRAGPIPVGAVYL